MSTLLKQVKKIPLSPGVYIFKDGKKVLYVGKAAILRKRVESYFFSQNPKTRSLLKNSKKVDYIKTDSVLEALILEANLIKKYWPFYNVREKDNRSFVYIVIPNFKIKELPSPFIIRGSELKRYPSNNFYIFGPYQSYSLVKKMLFLIRKVFPYCSYPDSGKPCFHYQIGLCPGACINKISKKNYQKIIKELILFLEGKKKHLIKDLKKAYPDKIKILSQIQDSALITKEETGDFFCQKFKIEGFCSITLCKPAKLVMAIIWN